MTTSNRISVNRPHNTEPAIREQLRIYERSLTGLSGTLLIFEWLCTTIFLAQRRKDAKKNRRDPRLFSNALSVITNKVDLLEKSYQT
jgi:hypothetical protein